MIDDDEYLEYNTIGTSPDDKACVTVRYADEVDLPQVFKMYVSAIKEIEGDKANIDLPVCARLIWDCFVKAPCVLLEKMGEIVGFCGLRTGVLDYSKDAYISEYMFYINPKHRSMKTARVLSNAAQDVAEKFKLPLYFTHFIGDKSIEWREKFLNRWGYKTKAINCIYEVQNG